MNKIKGIIFDFDGVLFDSLHANLAYYNTVFEAFGAPPVTADDGDKMLLCHTRTAPGFLRFCWGRKNGTRPWPSPPTSISTVSCR